MIVNLGKSSAQDHAALDERELACPSNAGVSFANVRVPKPWGMEYLFFQNEDVAIWVLMILPAMGTSMHCHPNKNTSLLVLDGTAHCRTLQGNFTFQKNQGIYLGKKVFHQTQNAGTTPLWLIEIESPVNKWDLVRIKDSYGRVDTGYEDATTYIQENGLTVPRDCKSAFRRISDANLIFGYAQTLSDLPPLEKHDVFTVLDRHVWNEKGEKLIEVGQSLRVDALAADIKINRGYHYLVLR